MNEKTYLCIDVGGTKTLVSVFGEDRNLIEELRFETPKEYPDFLKTLEENIVKISTYDILNCCVAIPGVVNLEQGKIVMLGNLSWENISICDDFRKILDVPVYIENDANLAGLAEALTIKNDYKNVLYLTFSTGVGGGWIINGVIEPNTRGAEVGHMIFEVDNEWCTWESFASGKAIVAKYGRRASDIGEEEHEIWDQVSKNFAVGIINCCANLTPEAVVIGGGVGTNFHKFREPLDQWFDKLAPEVIKKPKILPAQHPEEAVIYGCYEYLQTHTNN